MSIRSLLLLLLLTPFTPAWAQSEYGGGWAVPSLDTAISISNDVMRSQIGTEVGMRSIGRDKQGRPLSGRSVASTRSGFVPGTTPNNGPTMFSSALDSQDMQAIPAVQTSFTRSATLQKKSEAAILAAVKRRQPGAEVEYARVFAAQDMVRLFDKATRSYGLRNNDIADTMAAYWLVSWVVANDARDFSPAAARAVREQVKGGIARTSVAGFSPEKKHRLADEAIFNTLIATQAFEYAQSGKISKADYRRLGEVTQQAFIGFGADLRALRLTDSGFQKR